MWYAQKEPREQVTMRGVGGKEAQYGRGSKIVKEFHLKDVPERYRRGPIRPRKKGSKRNLIQGEGKKEEQVSYKDPRQDSKQNE